MNGNFQFNPDINCERFFLLLNNILDPSDESWKHNDFETLKHLNFFELATSIRSKSAEIITGFLF